ncbi:MAG: response regulator [Chloroflexi bacterium]|nr:response regulator [Chloroflexota bacterium]
MQQQPRILIVDDSRVNIKVLEALLVPRGYAVLTATSGEQALEKVAQEKPDLVLLDIHMPCMDGHEVCAKLREDPATRLLPVVMVTSSDEEDEKLKSIEAGADDFIPKPVNRLELLARVKSLLRLKEYHDTIETQAAQLAEWNRVLEDRVKHQVGELERLGRLRRFLSPQLADVIGSSGSDTMLQSHRQQIAVLFCDLRGFTAFVDSTEPDTVMEFLREYHEALGGIIFHYGGTLEHFEGDGVMVFFNDPVPCPEPAETAVSMAMAMRERVQELTTDWRKRGHELGFGVGIAFGSATLGMIGFEGRRDYGAVGTVVNLAARLCSQASDGQILVDEETYTGVEGLVEGRETTGLSLKGLARPLAVFELTGWLNSA